MNGSGERCAIAVHCLQCIVEVIEGVVVLWIVKENR